MSEVAQLNALLKITAAKVDIENDFLVHYINKILKIIISSDLNKHLHCKLLDKSVAFLDKWLIPLCGPEDCIDKEDLSVLPKSVQTVSGNPNIPRLFSADLCLTICQTFLQLHKYVSTVEGQISSSESGEKNLIKELLFYIEQVVDQLICEENERDQNYTESSLREISVDTITSEKLERAKQDYLECK
ncbi:unnamed protein product [Trichobilharzia regenti]|nr:unnamed protein product [Trichobilharzia regenti]